MTEEEDVPFARRAIGAAVVTSAAGAGLVYSVARPIVRDGIEAARSTSAEIRHAAVEVARGAGRAAIEAARPTLGTAFDVKNRLRRRAVGSLPSPVADLVDDWRHQLIEGEKAAYFGSLRVASELRPAFEQAQRRSFELLDSALGALDEVVDTSLAAALKAGNEIGKGELPAPPKRASAKKRPRRR